MLNKAKSKESKTWINRFAKFVDRMFDKFVPKKSAEEDARFQKACDESNQDMEDLEIKNAYVIIICKR